MSNYLTVADLVDNGPDGLAGFFGCPPDPDEKLADNIRRKRQHWHHLAVSSPAGKERAKQVVSLIEAAADALLNGATPPNTTSSTTPPPQRPWQAPIDERAHIVDLLNNEQYTDACVAANDLWNRHPGDTTFATFAAWVAVVAADAATSIDAARAASQAGINAARVAAAADIADGHAHLARLLEAGGWYDEAADAAASGLLTHPNHAPLLVVAASARLARPGRPAPTGIKGRRVIRAALTQLAKAVTADDTAATRAAAADVAIRHAAALLPIASAAMLGSYRDAVAVAAWAAVGVPDAESVVRPHRLWAARAAARVYQGNWAARSIAAAATGMLALPLLNRLRSIPAWKVLHAGDTATNTMYRYVTAPAFVAEAHGW